MITLGLLMNQAPMVSSFGSKQKCYLDKVCDIWLCTQQTFWFMKGFLDNDLVCISSNWSSFFHVYP